MIAGPQRRTRLMSEKEKLITAYHEGGHALVAAALPGTDPVHKITILPRGRALGYTMVLPDEDKYSQTRSEMLDKLAYMMGGRAAEEMVFHDPTTGAGNDIEKATALARAMVTQYGMTERLGAIKLGESNSEPFLGRDIGPPAQLLRGRRRDGRRGDQEAARRTPTRRRSTSSRRTATSSTRLVLELLDKETLDKERGRRRLRAAAPAAGAPGVDRVAGPQPVGDPAGRDPAGDPRPGAVNGTATTEARRDPHASRLGRRRARRPRCRPAAPSHRAAGLSPA